VLRRTDLCLSFAAISRRESGGCVTPSAVTGVSNFKSRVLMVKVQVPTEHVEHPNGVTGVAYLTILIPTKDLDEFERKLTSVIGFAPNVGLDNTRTWSLSTATGNDSPRLVVGVPQSEEEEEYVKERKGSIYNVAFRRAGPEGLLLV